MKIIIFTEYYKTSLIVINVFNVFFLQILGLSIYIDTHTHTIQLLTIKYIYGYKVYLSFMFNNFATRRKLIRQKDCSLSETENLITSIFFSFQFSIRSISFPTGYYRVNYDHKSWYKISSFLQYDNFMQIPVLNRAQLINDVYYFTMNNDIHVQHFLNIIKYLKWEKDFIAWHPMFNILSYMSSFFEYAESTLVKVNSNKLV